MTDTVRGARPKRVKPLPRNLEQRACTHPACRTILNGYNRGSLCYTHAPKQKPRSPYGRIQ